MPLSSYATDESQALTVPNGHHQEKSSGDTTFHGSLERLPYPPAGTDLKQQVEAMYTDGFAIFPGVLGAREVAHLRDVMDRMGEEDSQYEVPHWCFNKHLGLDFTRDLEFLSCIDRPGVVDVAAAIHDPGCHVLGGTAWITGPGRSMGIHLDYLPIRLPEYVHEDPAIRVPIFTSTAQFYVDDLEEELGPTIVIPGSHRAGRPPCGESTWHGIAPKAVMVKAGDVCLFRSDLWHGAAMNSSDRRRYLIQVFYGAGRIDVSRRDPLTCRPEFLSLATARQRQLLGVAG